MADPQKKLKLDTEFQYYKAHQAGLVNEYNGKYIVIVGEAVIGGYDSYEQAYRSAIADHPAGTFLIQLCRPGLDNYTQVFHHLVKV